VVGAGVGARLILGAGTAVAVPDSLGGVWLGWGAALPVVMVAVGVGWPVVPEVGVGVGVGFVACRPPANSSPSVDDPVSSVLVHDDGTDPLRRVFEIVAVHGATYRGDDAADAGTGERPANAEAASASFLPRSPEW
jgi:hypothetical protein